MTLSLGTSPLLRTRALQRASGLIAGVVFGLAPGLARASGVQDFTQSCDPLAHGCDLPIHNTTALNPFPMLDLANNRSGRLQPHGSAANLIGSCDDAARRCWPDAHDISNVGRQQSQLAQSFGTPAPGPYGSPFPRPNPGFPGPGPYPGAGPFPAPAPTVTPPANISFPAPGVICDQVYKLCYNNQGVSQPLSATTFGQAGFASAMLAIQRGLQKQFLLSNGTFCDVSVSACWSDGMGRRIPSAMMSNQLFYAAQPGYGVNPGPQIYPSVGPGASSGYANCRLQQGFQVIYNGQCQLLRQQDGNRYRFNAQLGNGTVYSFVNRNGNYRIRDNNGSVWPVSYLDQGGRGVFNWANYSLTLTQPGYAGGPSLGRSLGSLLESLFQ